jgi:hypothetical protein
MNDKLYTDYFNWGTLPRDSYSFIFFHDLSYIQNFIIYLVLLVEPPSRGNNHNHSQERPDVNSPTHPQPYIIH